MKLKKPRTASEERFSSTSELGIIEHRHLHTMHKRPSALNPKLLNS